MGYGLSQRRRTEECAATRAMESAGLGVGLMLQPGSGLATRADAYGWWAADNGCFSQGAALTSRRGSLGWPRCPRSAGAGAACSPWRLWPDARDRPPKPSTPSRRSPDPAGPTADPTNATPEQGATRKRPNPITLSNTGHYTKINKRQLRCRIQGSERLGLAGGIRRLATQLRLTCCEHRGSESIDAFVGEEVWRELATNRLYRLLHIIGYAWSDHHEQHQYSCQRRNKLI